MVKDGESAQSFALKEALAELSSRGEGKRTMSKRLYFTDSYLREFSGTVLECRLFEKSPAVILDQTAFYPESGGQPHDTGMLNGAHVLKVLDDESGGILHVLDREIPSGDVRGKIDWGRRFDHMQQHTGQHILSQAFIATAKAQTLSFHMGGEMSTIDINLAQPSTGQMEEAQALATEVVFQNRAVHILATDRDNLSSLGVRKESQREGEIRVIDIEGFDRSACGGTHVRNTGEIGVIFVSNFERYKGGTRVEFAAGGRALRLLRKDHELLRQLARMYSAAPEKLAEITEKLLQERTGLARENELLQDKLLEMEAAELLQSAEQTGNRSIVCRTFSGRKLDSVKVLAQKLTGNPGVAAILGIADACQIVLARSKDLQVNCGDAIKKIAAELGGKGGGRPELAQAGGFPAESMDLWMKALAQYFQS
jgi:alanyl-tRNA synthetase